MSQDNNSRSNKTQPQAPSLSRVEMNQLVLPPHTNSLGTVFGGTIMGWIDICAAMSAQRHAREVVVTASMDQLDFRAPIKGGQLVNLCATVNFVGRTSMEVGVRVEAEDTISGARVHAASAYLTFVAIDDDGKPIAVRPLQPRTPAEKLRYKEGRARREQRLRLAAERRRLAAEHHGDAVTPADHPDEPGAKCPA
jgi:acyl-CoA hydrolase